MWCTVLTAHVSIVRTRIEALACFTQSSLSTHRLLYRHAVSVTSPYFQQHNTIHYPDRHTSPFFYYRYFYSCIYADSTSTVSIPVYKVTQDLPFLFLFIFIISKVLFLFRKLYQFQYSYFCLQNYSPLTIPMSLYKITPIRLCPFPFTKWFDLYCFYSRLQTYSTLTTHITIHKPSPLLLFPFPKLLHFYYSYSRLQGFTNVCFTLSIPVWLRHPKGQ